MIPLLLLICGVWIAAGLGRTLLGNRKFLHSLPLERFVYSTALGLGVAAYLVLFIGLCGLLSFWPITFLWLALAVLGHRGLIANTKELFQSMRGMRTGSGANQTILERVVAMTGIGLALLFVAIALLACFKPPDALSWDALAYHLADPKLFLMDHRISSLPTEHHSNFPFLMEMLYTVGLLYDGYTLANLFHFMMGFLTALGLFGFCRRRFGALGGWCAVVLFISTPVVLWEAGVSYIELGLGLYTTLACFAAVEALSQVGKEQEGVRQEWLLLSGILMGFGLGTKYLALIPFGILCMLLLVRTRSFKQVLVFGAFALAVCSPWYVKNIIVTHNPVYPYIYKLFPGSRYWSADRAKAYESEQGRFGTEHLLSKPLTTLPNLLQVPWDLLTLPLKGAVTGEATYSNAGEFNMLTLFGGLYFAFNVLLMLRRRVPDYVRDLCVLGLLQVVAWFFVAQVSRYLVSILPLLAVTGAYAVSEIVRDQSEAGGRRDRISGGILAGGALFLIGGQALMTLWMVLLLPPQSRLIAGAQATPLCVPQIVNILSDPDGKQEYLKHSVQTYAVIDWINHNTPAGDRVLLYDDTLGFYLDRKYLWANAEHSSYIPYDQFKDGKELTDWMVSHQYRYALFNMKWYPQANQEPGLLYGKDKNEELAFQRWYAAFPDPAKPVSRWRALVADAIRRGLWTEAVTPQNGVYLVHIGPMEASASLSGSDAHSFTSAIDSTVLGRQAGP